MKKTSPNKKHYYNLLTEMTGKKRNTVKDWFKQNKKDPSIAKDVYEYLERFYKLT
jgi:hypothetical protein